MKKILGLITGLVTLALGTSVFAAAFTAGNIVVYRIGDGSQPVTNLGQTVFLDEYTPAAISNAIANYPATATPVQSIQMPTSWFGNQAPLIASAQGSALEGFMTLSVDGRYLVVPGFGATIGQLTNLTSYAFPNLSSNSDVAGSYTTNAVTEADVPRVVGLVDGFGHIYTSTTQTNVNEQGDEIRAAASLEGTNIWLQGSDGLRVKYTTRGSMLSTQVCANTSLEPTRAIGIFGNALYTDKNVAFAVATNTTAIYTNIVGGVTNVAVVNPLGGALPVVTYPTNFVVIPTVTNGSQMGFVMFNLANGNPGGPDTLYLADSAANFQGESRNYGGAVEKYCYVSGSWTYQGAIGAEDAYGVAGYQSGTNVTLYITEGTNSEIYFYTDTTGYNPLPSFGGNPQEIAEAPNGFLTLGTANPVLVNVRGVAVVPQGGDSGTISSGAGPIEVGPPYGPYFRGPQGGPFTPSNGVTYSVANFGTASAQFSVTTVGSPTWLTISPTSMTLSPGTSTTVTMLATNAAAAALNGGVSYTGNVIFHTGNNAGLAHYTNTATIVVDAFYVSPTTNFISTTTTPGMGPYVPSSAVYALSNATSGTLTFSAFTSNNWTSLSCNLGSVVQFNGGNNLTGSVPGHTSANITITINTNNANALTTYGSYDDFLVMTNTSAVPPSQITTKPEIILQLGFGIFDDFSTFSVGNVSGQNGWGGGQVPPDVNPVQIMTIVDGTNCVGCAGGTNEYVVPGGCANLSGTSQQPDKFVSSGPITNAYNIVGTVTNNIPTYAITGVLITFTNAPDTSNYVFEQGNSFLPWNDSGIVQNGAKYSWTTELDSYQTGGGPEGGSTYTFGTQYQVYFVTDFVESNAYVFVNPPGPLSGITDAVALVNNYGTSSYGSEAVLANWSNGEGADSCPGADCLGNSAQAWTSIVLGQYSGGCDPVMPGYFVTRVAASTNYAAVYNWLNPSPACTAPTATFTPTSASGAAPLSVNFTDTSSGTPTSWYWTFGDGNTSTSENPTDIYATPGSYTAQLIASNACGWSTNTASITVSSPFAWWESPSVYNLTGSLTGGNASYTGDGMSNTNKFMAGFNPTNAAAYLHVISITKAVAGGQTNVNVTYLGASGDTTYVPGFATRTNILEYTAGTGNGSYTSTNFTSTGLTNILGVGLSVNGGSGNGTVTNFNLVYQGFTNGYFRVRVLLP